MSKKLLIVTMRGCPYCVDAKKLLKQLKISYKEKELKTDSDWDWLEKKLGTDDVGVPQIFIGNKHIGGLHELQRYVIKRKLRTAAAAEGKISWNNKLGFVVFEGPKQFILDALQAKMLSRRIGGTEKWEEYFVWKMSNKRKFYYKLEQPISEWKLSSWRITCATKTCRVYARKSRQASIKIVSEES